jgi:hypothetical protein
MEVVEAGLAEALEATGIDATVLHMDMFDR